MTVAACDRWSPSSCEGTPHCPPRCPRFVDRDGVPWTVRPLESIDTAPLYDMYRGFDPDRRAQGLPPLTEARLEDWLDVLVDEGCNLVATREGEVAGHAVYTPTDAAEPGLAVFVHQEFQHRGLGTELCRHIVATAAAGDRDGLVLSVGRANRTAIAIYERLGFCRSDRPDGAGSRPREIRMRLPFPSATGSRTRLPPVCRG